MELLATALWWAEVTEVKSGASNVFAQSARPYPVPVCFVCLVGQPEAFQMDLASPAIADVGDFPVSSLVIRLLSR